MAQGPSDTILVAIRITLRIWESKVRNPDPPDRRRFVLSEHSFLVMPYVLPTLYDPYLLVYNVSRMSVALYQANVTCLSVCLSVLKVYRGKTAE